MDRLACTVLKYTKFGQLSLGKVIKIADTSCHNYLMPKTSNSISAGTVVMYFGRYNALSIVVGTVRTCSVRSRFPVNGCRHVNASGTDIGVCDWELCNQEFPAVTTTVRHPVICYECVDCAQPPYQLCTGAVCLKMTNLLGESMMFQG